MSQPRDRPADIWAFGCVLYEMLTGRQLFQGSDLAETLASIVKDQPDLNTVAPQVRRLLARCLEKDSVRRLRDLGDAWDLLPSSNTTDELTRHYWRKSLVSSTRTQAGRTSSI